MTARRITWTVVVLILIATTAGTIAGWSAYPPAADAAKPAANIWTQSVNSAAKSDRLAAARSEALAAIDPASGAAAEANAAMALASFETRGAPAPERRVAAAEPKFSNVMALASVDPRDLQAVAPPPPPAPAKPVVAAPPKPKAPPPNGLFDEGQLAGLRNRLKLTPSQAQHWPAVEAALRDVIRHQAREMKKKGHAHGAAPRIDVHSPEVQRLIQAAFPLLMQLTEEQKREVRQLARVIGLEQVARQI